MFLDKIGENVEGTLTQRLVPSVGGDNETAPAGERGRLGQKRPPEGVGFERAVPVGAEDAASQL